MRLDKGSLNSKKHWEIRGERQRNKGRKPLTSIENMHAPTHIDGLVALGVLTAHPVPRTTDESRVLALLSWAY